MFFLFWNKKDVFSFYLIALHFSFVLDDFM